MVRFVGLSAELDRARDETPEQDRARRAIWFSSAQSLTSKLYKVHIEFDSSRSRVGEATPVLSQIVSGPLDVCDLRSLHE